MVISRPVPDELDNRRREPRTRVYFPLICHIGENNYVSQTIDVSPSGMRMRIPVLLDSGALLSVSSVPETGLAGRQKLLCRSLWVRNLGPEGCEVGTYYADSAENLAASWVQAAIQSLGLRNRVNRRHRRIPAKICADLQNLQGQCLGRAVCLNLSYGGALVHFDKPLDPHDMVLLRLGSKERELVLRAKVVQRRTASDNPYLLHSLYFLAVDKGQRAHLRSLLQTLLQLAEADENLLEEPVVKLKQLRLTPIVSTPADFEDAWPAAPPILNSLPPPALPPALSKILPPLPRCPDSSEVTRSGEERQRRNPSLWGARTLPLVSTRAKGPRPPDPR